MRLQDKVAIVTGTSPNICGGIADMFAAEGAAVAICSRPNPGLANLGTLDGAREELEALGGREQALTFVRAALERGISVITATKTLIAHHGPALQAIARRTGARVWMRSRKGAPRLST